MEGTPSGRTTSNGGAGAGRGDIDLGTGRDPGCSPEDDLQVVGALRTVGLGRVARDCVQKDQRSRVVRQRPGILDPRAGIHSGLVVLDLRRVDGQGPAPPRDDRQGVEFATQTAAAEILLPDFATSPNKYAYCANHAITVGVGMLEVKVTQQQPELPFAYYRFDRRLRLTSVQPELNYTAKLLGALPKSATGADRQAYLMKRLGGLKVIRNEFDLSFAPEVTGDN
jgi:hypothetical protein